MEPDDLYCRLYINSPGDLDELRSTLAGLIEGKVAGRNVLNAMIDFHVVGNDTFDPKRSQHDDGFTNYPYTAEVEASYGLLDNPSATGVVAFIDILCQAIVGLRSVRMQVVASCAYEDEISEKTGWNWTEKTPKHP
ncbi:MAG: hypothetical protein AAF674_11805 [Pseudomonadota bacterium]